MSPPDQPQEINSRSGAHDDPSRETLVEVAPPAADSAEPQAGTLPSEQTKGETMENHSEIATPEGPTGDQSGGGDLIDLGGEPDTEATEQMADSGVPGEKIHTDEMLEDEAEPDEPVDPMDASVATLKPTSTPMTTTETQYLNIDSTSYVDPTPPTPYASEPSSRTPSNSAPRVRHGSGVSDPSPTRSDAEYDEQRYTSEEEQEQGSQSEIQSIMDQFSEAGGGPGADEVMSPRLELTSPIFGSQVQHPPRKSSLEPLAPSIAHQISDMASLRLSVSSSASVRSKENAADDQGPPVPPKDGSIRSGTSGRFPEEAAAGTEGHLSPSISLHRPPPPEPEPEPALPFDFHRFLEQLRNKKADPVARYLKSFLSEFSKKQWMVHEQVKIISDFLAFIANKMAQCDVWREVSDAEFDNAREGMEKLVMNRLYAQTFSPAIPPPQPIPGAKPKKRGGDRPMGPGRRGQHQEDVERDEILAQKINIYGWVKEAHLDIPPVGDGGKRFLKLAQQGEQILHDPRARTLLTRRCRDSED